MALELEDPNFRLEDRERHLRAEPCAHVTDAKSVADGVRANKSVMGMGDPPEAKPLEWRSQIQSRNT